MSKGKLFVLCGVDGSGKTSQIGLLKRVLFEGFIYTREPGGTPKAEEIRSLLLSDEGKRMSKGEQMIRFFEARYYHFKQKIIPTTESGISVVSDRFDCCTYAYQDPSSNGIEDLFWNLRRDVVLASDVEVVYIYLSLPAELAMERESASNNHNHFDMVDIEVVKGRISRYEKFFEMPGVNSVVVDASQDMNQVRDQIIKIILDRIMSD